MAAMVLLVSACAELEEAAPSGEPVSGELEPGAILEGYADLVDGPHADHRSMHQIVLYEDAVGDLLDDEGRLVLEYPDPFLQVGLQFDAADASELSFRAQNTAGEWTEVQPVDIPWREAHMHNGLILLEEPATVLELRGAGEIEFAQVEFFETIVAREELIRQDSPSLLDTPVEPVGGDDIARVQQAVAPTSLVITRHQWNAISPDKVCGSVVAPYRMAIHHTASPSSDGGDAAARMRGMQNYHMNTLGWCDIGYHFVVAQSGAIYQARSRSNRPAAHVGGQNHGNVGISMIGNYTSAAPTQAQLEGMGKIVRWVHDTHGVPLNRTAILGHREHAGQSTSCPGNNGLAHINEIIDRAANGGAPPPPPPPPEYDVDIDVVINGLDDFYTQGTSAGVPDALEGDTFTAEIRVKNESSDPIRNVKLRFAFGEGLTATNYRIETDHPAYDQSSWQINDANEAPDNPDHSAMGQSGTLTMHAFSPNETKRVFVDLRADRYNLGIYGFRGVRAWVHHIDDVYAQNNWGSDPSVNNVGYRLRDVGRVDIVSHQEWQFRSGQRDDLEGWTAEGPVDTLALNTNYDLLAKKVEDLDGAAISPPWTRIDADEYNELVIRFRSHDGPHTGMIQWARDGEEFSDRRAVVFKGEGDSEYHTLVLPVGGHPLWRGEVTALRLGMNQDVETGEEESGWYDVDVLYFQNRKTGQTSSHTLDIVDQEHAWVDFPGVGEFEGFGRDPNRGMIGEAVDQDSSVSEASRVNVNQGCSAAGGESPASPWLAALVLGWLVWRRRE